MKGNPLPPAERMRVAQKLARLTGLSAEYVERTNLRIDPGRFRKELLRDKRLVIGRLDSRYTTTDLDAAGEQQEFDPSNTALQGAYTAMFMDYVQQRAEVGQRPALPTRATCARGPTTRTATWT